MVGTVGDIPCLGDESHFSKTFDGSVQGSGAQYDLAASPGLNLGYDPEAVAVIIGQSQKDLKSCGSQ
jgi:hypothetical protein